MINSETNKLLFELQEENHVFNVFACLDAIYLINLVFEHINSPYLKISFNICTNEYKVRCEFASATDMPF